MDTYLGDVILYYFGWGLAVEALLLCGLFYFVRGVKIDNLEEKKLIIGIAVLIMGFGVRLLFRVLYALSYLFTGNIRTALIYYYIGNILLLMTFTSFIFAFESTVKSKNYRLTVLNIVLIIIATILNFPYWFSEYIPYYELVLLFDIFLLFYILNIIAKESSFEFQSISSLLSLGFTLILGGIFMEYYVSLGVIHPFFYLTGAIVLILPLIIDPKVFYRSTKAWIIFIILNSLILIFPLYLLLFTDNYTTLFIVSIIFFSYVIISIVSSVRKIIKIKRDNIQVLKVKEDQEGKRDFLKIFTRPSKVTEEEVSVSKEKKICLVCKGKVAKFNSFICSCDTIYCQKCAKSLSSRENACWVCEEALDESKPVNLPAKEEKEIEEKTKEKKNSHKNRREN